MKDARSFIKKNGIFILIGLYVLTFISTILLFPVILGNFFVLFTFFLLLVINAVCIFWIYKVSRNKAFDEAQETFDRVIQVAFEDFQRE